MQLLEQRNRKHDAEDAVISTGVWNGIKMRSDQKMRSVRLCGGMQSSEISRGIDSHADSERNRASAGKETFGECCQNPLKKTPASSTVQSLPERELWSQSWALDSL
jgi:hypothetical protein